MSALQRCPNTSEAVPLYLPQQLFLRPIARLMISLQLPNSKIVGKSISHLEIIDKLRELIRPEEFSVIKVQKTTVEFVRFVAEVELKSKVERVVNKIDNRMIKLKDIKELLRVRSCEYRSDFPNRRKWDAFFNEARDMDEMKPGQRPDTILISNLPTKWFVPYHLSNDDDAIPSEKILFRIFEKFGNIRHVDIPICDPYRKKMKSNMTGLRNSTFENTEYFEGYVQFKDYIGFTKAMDALRDMKLVRKDDDGDLEVDIKVDFDKTKHLSEGNIRRREIVRDRLVKKAQEREEKERREFEEKKRKEEAERQREVDVKKQKEQRRRIREEKRKAKILQKLEITGSDEINEKIAREEKKLLKVQRKLEAIRLLEELFRRSADKHRGNVQKYNEIRTPAKDELKRFKNASELEVLNQKEKLHNALNGRIMLKTILSNDIRNKSYSSSSSEISLDEDEGVAPGLRRGPQNNVHPAELMHSDPSAWYYGFSDIYYQHPQMYQEYPMRGMYHMPPGRGMGPRPPMMAPMPGPSRGMPYNPRRPRRGGYRGNRYNPSQIMQYTKYIERFLNEHDDRMPPRRPRRSRSHSRSRRSHSRSRSRSKSRNRRSRSRSRSRRRSRSRSRSRERSRSRSRARDKSRSRSRSRDKSRSRSRSRSKKRSSRKEQEKRSSRREKSREKSPRTPPLEGRKKSRSRSWSMPKEGDKEWSKSPEKNGKDAKK